VRWPHKRNKTDRNDARGIAQMMRVGLYRPVHVKTLQSQKRRLLLTARKLLQAKLLDLEAELRGTLKSFGLRVGVVGKGGFRQRVRETIDGREALTAVMWALLEAAAGLGAPRSALPAPNDGARHRRSSGIMPTISLVRRIIRYRFHPRCGETVIVRETLKKGRP
jgi:transposase